MKIGVVSDTHGLLRPEVLPALAGVDQILHLGDVGDPAILKALEKTAPVHAIRGNIDRDGPCSRLPETDVLLFEGHYLYLLHDLGKLMFSDGLPPYPDWWTDIDVPVAKAEAG